MQTKLFLIIFICLLSGFAHGQVLQARSEFNWIPSGNLDVGNLGSENDSNYRSVGDIISANVSYSDGTRNGDNKGRRTDVEVFNVLIGRYRGGPCQGDMVIRRCIDTSAQPVELTISIDGQKVGKWTTPTFEGSRRFADVFYVVPQDALMSGAEGSGRMKGNVKVKITSGTPHDSFRYDFFITREWKFMPEEYKGVVVSRNGLSAADFYANALVKEGDHLWDEARALYKQASEKTENFELSRCATRRMRRCDYFTSASKIVDTKEERNFLTHFRLGQYCASNGFWNEALSEYTKAVAANTADGDATYNLAEAMEYCRMPFDKYAPLMGRAGWLYKRDDVNDVNIHVAINTYEIPGGPTGTTKAAIDPTNMKASFHNWDMIERMVFGASRGAWRINTTYESYTEKDPPWILNAGWLWGPTPESIPEWGMYDHTVSFAQYGSSHAGGIDCGPAWSGCCQVGPTRGWEVILHEWNHQFDWTAIFGEQGRAYPTTHDSDGCGKQPIVNMGCGHRNSMRYYLNPAQYRRIEPSDPNMPQTHIRNWALFGPLEAPVLQGTTSDEVIAELKEKGLADDTQINSIKGQPTDEAKTLATNAKNWFYNSRLMDNYKAVEDESTFQPDKSKKWKQFTDPDGGRIDLAAVFPDAAPKSFAYAHTYIWSPDDREVRVWYGYHDGLRVWHNGRMVHESRYYNVAYFEDPNWVDMVAGHLDLKSGWNRLLCKVERCAGPGGYGISSPEDWGFSVNLVNYDNTPVADLKYQAQAPSGQVAVYERPEVGKYYSWDKVKEDYLELLPELNEQDFRGITSIPELVLLDNIFLAAIPERANPKGADAITIEEITKGIGSKEFGGEKVTVRNFLELPIPGTPRGEEPDAFNKFKIDVLNDVTLNNFVNYDREGAGALRYIENGKAVDLLFIRPEYFEEYLNLIDDSKSGMSGKTKDRILGYWFIPRAAYRTTGNRTWRAVVVAKTYLGDKYPIDEQDILAVPKSE